VHYLFYKIRENPLWLQNKKVHLHILEFAKNKLREISEAFIILVFTFKANWLQNYFTYINK